MFYYFGAFFFITLHGLVDIQAGLYIILFFEQNPGVCIQIGRILWFGFHRFIAHFFCFVQILAFQGKIVSIVVQCSYVIGVIDQG